MKGKRLSVSEVEDLKDGDKVYLELHNVDNNSWYDSYEIDSNKIYTVKNGTLNSGCTGTLVIKEGVGVRSGNVKVFKYEEEKKMLDVREMKNYVKGKEICIEVAKKLPVGTLVWVTNVHIPNGEVRKIGNLDAYEPLRGSEIIQANGQTGLNGGFYAVNLKIYEWKEDVKMDSVQIIREVPKPVELPPIREIRFKTCFGKDVVIETKSGCSFGLSMSDGSREMYGAIEREDMKKIVQALTEMLKEDK